VERNKLTIIRGRGEGPETRFDPTDAESTFEVLFNPAEYSLRDENEYAELPIRGMNVPLLQYSRGSERTLSFSLVLDTYASGPTETRGSDVRVTYIAFLESLMRVDGDLHRPPLCKVVWGGLDFAGVLVSLEKRYTLFLNDGVPVRARVELRFQEVAGAEAQAMGTRQSSPDKVKNHTVRDGDSLWQIAYREYGDPARWRLIAAANDIDSPRDLEPGRELVVPVLLAAGGRRSGEGAHG
jgi:hypothetical protein